MNRAFFTKSGNDNRILEERFCQIVYYSSGFLKKVHHLQQTPSPFTPPYLENLLSSDSFSAHGKINALFQNAEEKCKV